MGDLARIGIAFGKAIRAEDLVGREAEQVRGSGLDEFSRRLLAHYGCLRIANRIQNGELLKGDEVEYLLARSPLPVLMKLVSLRRVSEVRINPSPVVCLPLSRWFRAHAETLTSDLLCQKMQDHLDAFQYAKGVVVLDEFDIGAWSSSIGPAVATLTTQRPALTLVGPRVDTLVPPAQRDSSVLSREARSTLERLLMELKEAGVKRLLPSMHRGSLALMQTVGFPTTFISDLTLLSTPRQLRVEMEKINEVNGNAGVVESWLPGVSNEVQLEAVRRGVTDLHFLRVLAVGTLALVSIPFRRASTHYLSLSAIRLSRFCGVNQFGFGALDPETAELLRIAMFSDLKEACQA